MRITTALTTVYQANDMIDYTAFKFTVVNNGGGQVDLAAFEYYTGSSWTSAGTVTSLYPINSGGSASVTVYSVSKSSVRLQLRATATIDVTVTVVPYRTAPDEAVQVADSVTDAVTNIAPSSNAVFDALALKAPLISPAFTTPTSDTLDEVTPAAGVTIDGVLLKDSTVKTDTIVEKTATAGVTADGVLLKDGHVHKIATATATSDGLTTGILTGLSQFVTVTSASANDIIALPALGATVVGTVIRGVVGANGFELRVAVADATTGKINDVTTNVEAAIPADTSFRVECISTTQWILTATTKLGAVVTAIIPDAV